MNTKLKHLLSKDGLYWMAYYFLCATKLKKLLSDKSFLKLQYRCLCGEPLNISNPQTYNEKLAWIKLYDHNPLYHTLVDKYAVKKVVTEKIGEEHVAKPLVIFNSYKEFDFDKLPAPPFVIKSVHYGQPIVVRTEADLDRNTIMQKLEYQAKHSGYTWGREWGYKGVAPRVMVEEYLSDGSENQILQDYKFWCFNGEVKCMYITIKDKDVYENFYDKDFNILDIDHGFPRHQPEFEKPDTFEEMWQLATKLSEGIPFVRVDFYSCGGKVYFGEYTFFDWGGLHAFRSYEMDKEIGSWLTLPREKRL